uniref:Retinol dehydrogenase 20 n=1 Tax=Salmo trutta TaxID=8032 RepID=A0A673Y989_SALTR
MAVVGELVLITGSGGALGRLFALEFTKCGAEVVLWDVDANNKEETARLVREAGGKAYPYRVDVTNRVEVYRTADEVWTDLGRNVTMLVNNAGVVAGEQLMDCPDELVGRTMKVNCHTLFWMTKAFVPQMKEQNHGHIITIASILGLFSTACVESLAHKLLTEEWLDGVKTTVVCPYIVDTGMFDGSLFLAPLEPEYCVEQAMNAILIDQPLVCIPRLTYLYVKMISYSTFRGATRGLLPWASNVVTYRFMGSDKCMYPFIKSKKNKLTNGGPTLIVNNNASAICLAYRPSCCPRTDYVE